MRTLADWLLYILTGFPREVLTWLAGIAAVVAIFLFATLPSLG